MVENESYTQDPIVIVNGGNILFAYPDGRLHAAGPDWKECPRPEKPCPRNGRNPMPEMYSENDKKCKRCVYAATAYLNNREQAVAVAKLIYPDGQMVL